MIESFVRILPESVPALNKNLFDTLLTTIICTLLIWYARYHWNRRKLYRMAAQRKGPSTLPFLGNALYFLGSSSDILNNMLRLANEFESPVRVWLGQSLMFGVWNATDLETIMNSPDALKKNDVTKFTEIAVGTGIFSAPVDKWKRHRKIIMPTFNQKILDNFVEVFSEQSEILVKQLQKEAGKEVFDIHNYVSRCTLDIICETAMGVTVNAQTTDCNYFRWLHTAMRVVHTRMVGVLYHSDYIFNRTSMAKELYDAVKKMNKFTSAVITENRKSYQQKLKRNREPAEALFEEELLKRKPFLQQLIEVSEQGAHFTDQELLDEVNTLTIAASDTTASVESFLFIILGMFPDIQKTVYEEVIEVLGPNRSVECKDLGKMEYLERVIKETMRIFPAAPLIGRDITGDIKLKNCTIPAGCSVILSVIATHRDPSLWPNPLKFDPDRFLPEEVAKRHPYSYLPFSGGPRNCVGLKFAMMSVKVLIATVIRKYCFFSDYKTIEDIQVEANLVLQAVNGYRVSIESRE